MLSERRTPEHAGHVDKVVTGRSVSACRPRHAPFRLGPPCRPADFPEVSVGWIADPSPFSHPRRMQRSSGRAITGWAAILLAPVAIPVALVARLWPGKKTVDRTPDDVVGFLRDFLEGTGGDWDWDEFESVPIADPDLESVRRRALRAAPPNPDLNQLRALLAEAEAIAQSRVV